MSEARHLEAALRLGAEIAAAAIWSGECCSWVGGMPDEGPAGEVVMTYASFGPDLYAGTAGVGLVLAELCDAGGEDDLALRRVASGALEHALARAEEVPASVRLGAYGGRLGIALAAARAGKVLGEPDLTARTEDLVAGLDFETGPLENDLLLGRAGGILALLCLRELDVEGADLELAVGLGEDLLDAAQPERTGWSWPSPSSPGGHNLTGLSHGAAGIAVALLELHRASGEPEYLAAAEAAFEYEHSLFDPQAGNWPDLREQVAGDWGAPCSTLWCHGAPGIALSRLRACELGAGGDREREARVALATTGESIRRELGTGNYSLCHGLAGNAEVVAEGAARFGDEPALAREVAAVGVERHLESEVPWPLGVHDGHTDSLMLGRAGTAYFYLRLHDPRRPSLLLLRPESFGR